MSVIHTNGGTFPTYTYPNFTRSDALRLIRLHPAANLAHDDLKCDISECPFKSDQQYEALSWTWGNERPSEPLFVNSNDDSPLSVCLLPPHLAAALKALRDQNRPRYLWVDAICINQANIKERNDQVPMMDQIYGNATNVCIWLGPDDEKSHRALNFIRRIVRQLWAFDEICSNRKLADDWEALMSLMRRPWFSRRWVIQEIALAKSGILYCGRDNVPWQDFADAVSLFTEVESATHRLSEIMKLDEKYNHVPKFFGEVPCLGAAVLVDASSNLFRKTNKGRREPLSSLEYLVSSLSVFDATQPRDIIYALLAISKDTTPKSVEEENLPEWDHPAIAKLRSWARRNMSSKTYAVDYKQDVVDVYKDFIEFSIRKSDQSRALDILCRPWAPKITLESDRAAMAVSPQDTNPQPTGGVENQGNGQPPEQVTMPMPSWVPCVDNAAFRWWVHPDPSVGQRMERRNADPLVGLPTIQRSYSAAGTRHITPIRHRFARRPSYNSMFVEGFVFDHVQTKEEAARLGNIPTSWLAPAGWHDPKKEDPPEEFWRTLVADRGPNGQNPPSYYRRACRESMLKVSVGNPSNDGNPLDTSQMIDQGRCSIIAEFLRRVQAVIWNRCLLRTRDNRIGLVNQAAQPGDRICILYGCSVPIVLREHIKSPEQIRKEREEHRLTTNEEAAKLIQRAWKTRKRERESLRKIIDQKIIPHLDEGDRPRTTRQRSSTLPLLKANFYKSKWSGIRSRLLRMSNTAGHQVAFLLTSARLLLFLYLPIRLDLWGDFYGRFIATLCFVKALIVLYSKEFYESAASNALWLMANKKVPSFPPSISGRDASRLFKEAISFAGWSMIIWRHTEYCQSRFSTWWSGELLASIVLLFPHLHRTYWMFVQKWDQWLEIVLLKPDEPVNDEFDQFYYEIIGECYVHGMMNGEALEWQNEKEVKARIFELR